MVFQALDNSPGHHRFRTAGPFTFVVQAAYQNVFESMDISSGLFAYGMDGHGDGKVLPDNVRLLRGTGKDHRQHISEER